MSLAQQAQAALAALPSPTVGPLRIDVAEAGQHFECDLSALDSLGCAFEQFVVKADKLQAAGLDELKKVSEALSKRLTYLLEPIQPIEIDRDQCVIQMRSVPPAKDNDRTSYYEIIVRRGGELSLVRYTADYGAGRQVALAQVTREVLIRLVKDFSAVAS
jgi:hypothetical protein